jgi:HAE1 family hydrophobic/amphiphilic exporter-1
LRRLFSGGPTRSAVRSRRNLTIRADLTGGVQLGDALNKVEALPVLKNPPPGLGRASQGQEQALAQLTLGFLVAFAEAIGLVYLVMVLLIRSFFKPVIIMMALPTAVVAARSWRCCWAAPCWAYRR